MVCGPAATVRNKYQVLNPCHDPGAIEFHPPASLHLQNNPGRQALPPLDTLRKLSLGRTRACPGSQGAVGVGVGTQPVGRLHPVCERMLAVSRQGLGSVRRVRSGRGRGLTSETLASRLEKLEARCGPWTVTSFLDWAGDWATHGFVTVMLSFA